MSGTFGTSCKMRRQEGEGLLGTTMIRHGACDAVDVTVSCDMVSMDLNWSSLFGINVAFNEKLQKLWNKSNFKVWQVVWNTLAYGNYSKRENEWRLKCTERWSNGDIETSPLVTCLANFAPDWVTTKTIVLSSLLFSFTVVLCIAEMNVDLRVGCTVAKDTEGTDVTLCSYESTTIDHAEITRKKWMYCRQCFGRTIANMWSGMLDVSISSTLPWLHLTEVAWRCTTVVF